MKRKITISIMAPVTVELLVKPEDPDSIARGDGSSWEIDCVLRADLNQTITPRSIYENIDDAERREIDRLASVAPDRNDRKLSAVELHALKMLYERPRGTTTSNGMERIGGRTAAGLIKLGLARWVKHEDLGTAVQITHGGIARLDRLKGPR